MNTLRATLLAVLATAAPALADDAGLSLVVRGSIDHATVRDQLARELGAPVTEVLDRCTAPCLDVSVDGATATLLFTPPDGPVRMRTVPLGGDAAQWTTVITLLAGNLVRDEAAAVLAGLPAPAAPASAAPAIVIPPPAVASTADARRAPRRRPVGVGLVPIVSSDLTEIGTYEHAFSLDLLVGVSGGSRAASISGVVDIERGAVRGLQLGGVAAIAARARGVQVGGVAAVADELAGVQLGGAVSVARRGRGTQLAGALAVADAGHAQVAGALAVARRAHVQIAGAASIAGTADVQVAGGLTIARDLRGVQIAPINVARRNAGTQVGVVNIGGSADGVALGLINIVPGGRTDVEAAVDQDQTGALLLRHGSRRWHNVYGVAGQRIGDELPRSSDVWMVGLGMGPSWRAGDVGIDLEAMAWQVNHGARWIHDDLSLLNQLRLTVAVPVGPLTLVAGGALNVHVSSDAASPLLLARRAPDAPMAEGVEVAVWPTAFVGVRIGR